MEELLWRRLTLIAMLGLIIARIIARIEPGPGLILRGPTQNFGQKLPFFFFAEKTSSGMWEICPKILGGYEY